MQSLDDVFNENESAGQDAQSQQTDEQQEVKSDADGQQEQAEGKAETETKSDADSGSKGEETQGEKEVKPERETPERNTDETDDWRFAAYRDEKRKRQLLEKELEELRKPKEQEKAPDVLNDPDGYLQFQQQQTQKQVLDVKAQISQFHAEKEFGKEKVQKAFDTFSGMVKDNPDLYQKVVNSVSPYHEIVDIVSKAEKFQQMENIEQYEAKVRAEIEAKVRAEFEKEYNDKTAKKSVTPSLNSFNQAGGDSSEGGAQSLGDLLGR